MLVCTRLALLVFFQENGQLHVCVFVCGVASLLFTSSANNGKSIDDGISAVCLCVCLSVVCVVSVREKEASENEGVF